MSRAVPALVSSALERRHAEEGVQIRCSERAVGLTREGGCTQVVLASGDVLDADLVLACLGVLPRVEVAERSGLDVDDGIVVDERLLTSGDDVFAAGDCCSAPQPLAVGRRMRLESWRNAQEQGQAAAATCSTTPGPTPVCRGSGPTSST